MPAKSASKEATKSKTSAAAADEVWKLFKLGDEIVKALRGVTVDIAEGELACFMGPSGSGKSTLLHLLGGLERPTKGEISIHGNSLAGLTESQLSLMRHQHVGFIFQSFNLIARTSSWRFCTSASMAASAPPASTRSWTGSASPIARAIVRRSCRAASSSAWRWRGRWWAGRR